MVGSIKYVNNGKMTVYRTPTFSFYENEEDFDLFVQNVKGSVKEVEKKRYIASDKENSIPWQYSSVKKELEKQRLELEKTYLAKLKFLR